MEFIYEIENALSKEDCEDLIERFIKSEEKERATIEDDVYSRPVRKGTNVWIGKQTDLTEKIIDTFEKSLNEYGNYLLNGNHITLPDANNMFGTKITFEQPFITQSKEGEYYHWHIDDMYKSNSDIKIRRLFSCIIYLNTLEEDQGGCTEFMCGKKVKPEQGKMLIFPSTWTYTHRGAIVKNGGVKYICGTWVS